MYCYRTSMLFICVALLHLVTKHAHGLVVPVSRLSDTLQPVPSAAPLPTKSLLSPSISRPPSSLGCLSSAAPTSVPHIVLWAPYDNDIISNSIIGSESCRRITDLLVSALERYSASRENGSDNANEDSILFLDLRRTRSDSESDSDDTDDTADEYARLRVCLNAALVRYGIVESLDMVDEVQRYRDLLDRLWSQRETLATELRMSPMNAVWDALLTAMITDMTFSTAIINFVLDLWDQIQMAAGQLPGLAFLFHFIWTYIVGRPNVPS